MQKYRVLLVDDRELHRKILREMDLWNTDSRFRLSGEANSGEEALERLASERYDVVIADVIMPEMDGLQLLSRIRAQFPGVRVILMSGLKDFDFARQALINGAADYLVKPITSIVLEESLLRIENQLDGIQEDPNRDPVCAYMAEQLCAAIRSGKQPDPQAIEAYLTTAFERPGLRCSRKEEVLIRAVRLVMERLYWDYHRMNFRPVAQVVIRYVSLNEGNHINICTKALNLVAKSYWDMALPTITHELVRKVVRLTLEHVQIRNTAESIATALYVNRSYLSQVFKRQTGISLSDYLLRMKMYQGMILLGSGGVSVSEVGIQLGYKDEEHFSKIFREHTGMLPGEYRKRFRE